MIRALSTQAKPPAPPTFSKFLALFVFLAGSGLAQNQVQQVAAVLDDWHEAASVANEARYFGHFAANGVFMGTDATERWTVREFRAWAKPQFQRKSAWSFKARDRHIDFAADGKTAWFDEMLDTPNLGVCRGSGVLVRTGRDWKIAQYNLSIAIPNALAGGIVKEIVAQQHN
jgi:SnoaL-like domain